MELFEDELIDFGLTIEQAFYVTGRIDAMYIPIEEVEYILYEIEEYKTETGYGMVDEGLDLAIQIVQKKLSTVLK